MNAVLPRRAKFREVKFALSSVVSDGDKIEPEKCLTPEVVLSYPQTESSWNEL